MYLFFWGRCFFLFYNFRNFFQYLLLLLCFGFPCFFCLVTQIFGNLMIPRPPGIFHCSLIMGIMMSNIAPFFNQQFAHLQISFFSCIVEWSLLCKFVTVVEIFGFIIFIEECNLVLVGDIIQWGLPIGVLFI